jgi:hypothetical protein
MSPNEVSKMRKRKGGRVATADKIATLLRVFRAAVKAGDDELRQSAFDELKSKYGVDLAIIDPADIEKMIPPSQSEGGDR